MENYLKPYKWTYLNENIQRSNNSKQRTGHFRITNGISKPRHVFVFINTANIANQRSNSFLYNTFSVSTDPRTLNRCYLEVGKGNEYPDIHYKPNEDLSKVYRDVLSYVHANNDFQGTLLNICNFKTLFPFVYFDLTKQKWISKTELQNYRFITNYQTTQRHIVIFTLLFFMKRRLKSNNKVENVCYELNFNITL